MAHTMATIGASFCARGGLELPCGLEPYSTGSSTLALPSSGACVSATPSTWTGGCRSKAEHQNSPYFGSVKACVCGSHVLELCICVSLSQQGDTQLWCPRGKDGTPIRVTH
eukprot:559835-Pelagomonas_calceolata.AAC.2